MHRKPEIFLPCSQSQWIAFITYMGTETLMRCVEVVARADRVVADSLSQCPRLGEIHHAVEERAISKDKATAELGEITEGFKPGRTSDHEIIVCDLTGIGVQDVAAASVVLERALQEEKGERLSL